MQLLVNEILVILGFSVAKLNYSVNNKLLLTYSLPLPCHPT